MLSSRDALTETCFFSAKKKQHSITCIVIIEPGRWASHVTRIYPGSKTDGSILLDMWESWSGKFLPPNCITLADGGCPGNSRIVISEGRPNSRDLMPLRSDIECYFSLVKNFRVCSDRIRSKLAGNENRVLRMHNVHWTTVIGLFNYRMCPNGNYSQKTDRKSVV